MDPMQQHLLIIALIGYTVSGPCAHPGAIGFTPSSRVFVLSWDYNPPWKYLIGFVPKIFLFWFFYHNPIRFDQWHEHTCEHVCKWAQIYLFFRVFPLFYLDLILLNVQDSKIYRMCSSIWQTFAHQNTGSQSINLERSIWIWICYHDSFDTREI